MSIGRRDSDIVIRELAISRLHTIFVREPLSAEEMANPTGAPPKLFVYDMSKFGTFINGQKGTTVEPPLPTDRSKVPHRVAALGDIIRLGTSRHYFRVEFTPLVVCSSQIEPEIRDTLEADLRALGGRLVLNWGPACTHLAMSTLSLTSKLGQCLAAVKPVVLPAFFHALLSAPVLQPAPSRPTEAAFLPPMDASVPILDPDGKPVCLDLFHPNPARRQIFAGKRMMFLTPLQHRLFGDVVTEAGGSSVLVNAATITDHFLRTHRTLSDFILRPPAEEMDPTTERAVGQIHQAGVPTFEASEIACALLLMHFNGYLDIPKARALLAQQQRGQIPPPRTPSPAATAALRSTPPSTLASPPAAGPAAAAASTPAAPGIIRPPPSITPSVVGTPHVLVPATPVIVATPGSTPMATPTTVERQRESKPAASGLGDGEADGRLHLAMDDDAPGSPRPLSPLLFTASSTAIAPPATSAPAPAPPAPASSRTSAPTEPAFATHPQPTPAQSPAPRPAFSQAPLPVPPAAPRVPLMVPLVSSTGWGGRRRAASQVQPPPPAGDQKAEDPKPPAPPSRVVFMDLSSSSDSQRHLLDELAPLPPDRHPTPPPGVDPIVPIAIGPLTLGAGTRVKRRRVLKDEDDPLLAAELADTPQGKIPQLVDLPATYPRPKPGSGKRFVKAPVLRQPADFHPLSATIVYRVPQEIIEAAETARKPRTTEAAPSRSKRVVEITPEDEDENVFRDMEMTAPKATAKKRPAAAKPATTSRKPAARGKKKT
ncbi:putative nibrin [Paratrimastix pyriformis]|uniref:Nibrin n=1 Tax=Paratrimastix pyriformis TaxID=342808 RepID=A0ABQ8UT30_9EUKA|nr:putative nibrin [Paratrimastix pyriformis]